jgi:hypothetical protein
MGARLIQQAIEVRQNSCCLRHVADRRSNRHSGDAPGFVAAAWKLGSPLGARASFRAHLLDDPRTVNGGHDEPDSSEGDGRCPPDAPTGTQARWVAARSVADHR